MGQSSENNYVIETKLNSNLERLAAWAKRWLITYNPDKTEAVTFSLAKDTNPISLCFNDVSVKGVNSHKHLGITFSADGKWSAHIEKIIKVTSKMISSLRKLKYLLSRSVLNKIYILFIRPHFEYACEVWDGCAQYQANRIEQLQLEAARIVTGLPKYTPVKYLYFETGWETLSERRRKRKLCLFYKIQNEMVPTYLSELVPSNVASKTRYNLRNSENITVPITRLKIYYESFIPSTIRMWNDIPVHVRNSSSVSTFKYAIKTEQNVAPQYFSYGARKANIILTKLRYMCSQLNYDLFRIGIKSDPSCECGNSCENSHHYLSDCKTFISQRRIMMSCLPNSVRNSVQVTTNLLLNGSADLTLIENQRIFEAVQTYICQTERF